MGDFKSFEEFWPFYLKEHSNVLNRRLHFVGTSSVVLTAFTAVFTQQWLLFALLPVLGYGPAWVGHFLVEHNRPATFKHPLWSLRGDFRMVGLMWLGRLGSELQRAGVQG